MVQSKGEGAISGQKQGRGGYLKATKKKISGVKGGQDVATL